MSVPDIRLARFTKVCLSIMGLYIAEAPLITVTYNIVTNVFIVLIQDKVKNREIQSISDLLNNATLRLPTNPGHEVNGLDLNLCTYFNSFTVPLKLVFRSVEVGAPNHYLMYKVGLVSDW